MYNNSTKQERNGSSIVEKLTLWTPALHTNWSVWQELSQRIHANRVGNGAGSTTYLPKAAIVDSAMGMLIEVKEKPSSVSGIVRFETNRALTGMGHENYGSLADIFAARPPDEIARALFETGAVDHVHIHANHITVRLGSGASTAGMATLIADTFIHYKPGVVPTIV